MVPIITCANSIPKESCTGTNISDREGAFIAALQPTPQLTRDCLCSLVHSEYPVQVNVAISEARVNPDHKDGEPDPTKATPQETVEPNSSPRTEATAKVDIWFDAQLTQLYGEVLNEPIPEDLLHLIRKMRPST